MSKLLKENLARYAHQSWSGWMRYLFEKSTANGDGTITVPKWAVGRWKRQMDTSYDQLLESEKASDRIEADKILNIVKTLDTQEFLKLMADYLEEKQLWHDFREWMESAGYPIEEMPAPFDEE